MSARYLTEADVARLLDMRIALEAVQEAFERLGAGEADNAPRQRVQAPGMVLHSMSAAAGYLRRAGWKSYSTTRRGAQFLIGLYDTESGELLALIEANRLGQLRTGATTGVAASWMAAPEAAELGLFGTGWQARGQLAALAAVRPIKQVYVYSRRDEQRETFAREMSQELGLEVIPVDRPQEAAQDLPLVVTATSSREPVFDGQWLSEGAFVAAVGSNRLTRAEVDCTVVRRADTIVCDSVAACRNEAGDLAAAIETGVFAWSQAVDLADVVSGRAAGRRRTESITLFKSVGMAIEDVALASRLLDIAVADGAGQPLPF